ncbi:MAG: RNA methyltransferase [Propionibacteriaceae bacterium]|nr:RNA methyltransferase [Propionibacteriaceae bacterium]
MATFTDITDPADPRLGDYVSLRDSSLRRRLETDGGLFIAEGEKVIARAWQAGYVPRSFLLAPRWIPRLDEVLGASPVPCYVVTESLAEQVTGFHVHRGALAAFHRGDGWDMGQVVDGATRLIVVEDIVDHANIGAILRSAAGLGWDGVLLSPRCADPLYRRAVKTSMGAVFSLPWARMPDQGDPLDDLRARGFTIVAMALTPESVPLSALARDLAAAPRPVAVLLGTEGAGLSDHWLERADVVVRIPMSRGTDSLNVAAATAIACYALNPDG